MMCGVATYNTWCRMTELMYGTKNTSKTLYAVLFLS